MLLRFFACFSLSLSHTLFHYRAVSISLHTVRWNCEKLRTERSTTWTGNKTNEKIETEEENE